MAKLLKVLTSIALTTIVPAASLTDFSYQENSIQDYQWKDPLGADVKDFKLTETKKGQLLKDIDKTKLNDEIVQVLIEANSLANIPSKDIFTFNLNQVTSESKTLWVNVQATLPTIDKSGLNAGTVKVVLDLTAKNQDQISPVQEVTVSLQLNETKKIDEFLTENDQTRLEKTVLQALVKVNRTAANVSEKTFDLGDLTKLAPTATEINVTCQATKSTTDKPGLTAGSMKVKLNLTPANLDRAPAQSKTIQKILKETQKNKTLTSNDQTFIHQEILTMLKETNKDAANVTDETFVIPVLNNLTPETPSIVVQVNSTFSTGNKAGLMAQKLTVALDLTPANQEKKNANPSEKIVLNLNETSNGETLKGEDINLVHDAIIAGMKKANSDSVFNDRTFTVDVTNLTPKSSSVQVQVQATDSTVEKHGLTSKPVNVDLALTPIFYEINAHLEKETIKVKESTTLTIENYTVFKNLQVKGDEFADTQYNNDGTATITAKEIGQATITISADNVKNPKTLTLKINPNNQQIVDAINKQLYKKQVNFKSLVTNLKNNIDAEFIKKDLPNQIKTSFQDDLFTLNELYINSQGVKRKLEDADLAQKVDHPLDIEINYGYSLEFPDQTAKLELTIYGAEVIPSDLFDGRVNALIHAKNGTLYVGTQNGNVWAIDENSGKPSKGVHYELKDLNNQPEPVYSLVQADDPNLLYAGTIQTSIWEINLQTGSTTKIFMRFGGVDNDITSVLIAGKNNKLYAGSGVGNTYELDLNTKQVVKYRFDDFSAVNSVIQAANGKLYAGTSGDDPRSPAGYVGGSIFEVDLATGIFSQIFNFNEVNTPILDIKEINQNQLILTTQSKICSFDLKSKKMTTIKELKNEGRIFKLVEGPHQEVYVATEKGNVFELDLDKKEIKNEYSVDAAVYSLLIVDKKIWAGTEVNLWELDIV